MNFDDESNPLLYFDDEESVNSNLSNDFKKEYDKIFKYDKFDFNNSNICDICYEKIKIEENKSKIETQNSTNNDNIIHNVEKKKPGRKTKTDETSKKKKTHGRIERGNINSKIKNYFINKVIKHLNKKIIDYFGNQKTKFRKIKYKINNIRNKNENKNLLCKKLKDFLIENKISKKFKNFYRNQNQKTINFLENKNILNYQFEENSNLSIYKNEPNIFECLEMTIETFYKEIFLKKYLNEFINRNIEKERKREKEKEYDVDYITKLKEEAENFIEYYNNDENENKNYLSKKRKNKFIFKITNDN